MLSLRLYLPWLAIWGHLEKAQRDVRGGEGGGEEWAWGTLRFLKLF